MEQIAGYLDERQRTELALRMIGHEARTCTIKSCTGLSDDRIRRLYGRYFKDEVHAVKRQRGKSPSRTSIYVRNATYQCEATSLAMLLLASDVLALAPDGSLDDLERANPLEIGLRFCLAFETYRSLHRTPHFCFERAWGLYRALERGDELVLMACAACAGVYVHHVMEMDEGHCPCCRLKGVQRRRSAKSVCDLATRRRHAASRAQAG
ncbi:MAG: FlhC family transcriptional regulator [Pseudomonadota bacterium]